MKKAINRNDDVCTTKKVAEILGVTQRTVLNWVEDGKLTSWRTMGGHRRFSESMVRDLSKRIRLSKLPKEIITHDPANNPPLNLSVSTKNTKSSSKYHILVIGCTDDKIIKLSNLNNLHLTCKEDAYSGLIEVSRNIYDVIIICINDSMIANITQLMNSLLNDLDISHSKLLLIKQHEGVVDQSNMHAIHQSDEFESISAVIKTLLGS